LLFDNITVVNADKRYVNATYSFGNTPDGEASVLNYDVFFHVDILREQQRMNFFTPIDENDKDYSKLVMSTPIDSCKLSKGVQTQLFSKVLLENHKRSHNIPYTCPFLKNVHLTLTNCTLTDTFLPPMQNEFKFKVLINFYGKLKGKKGWTFTYGLKTFGRYRKWLN
jgi:Protein of unknown function (DUF1091)